MVDSWFSVEIYTNKIISWMIWKRMESMRLRINKVLDFLQNKFYVLGRPCNNNRNNIRDKMATIATISNGFISVAEATAVDPEITGRKYNHGESIVSRIAPTKSMGGRVSMERSDVDEHFAVFEMRRGLRLCGLDFCLPFFA